MRGTYGSILAGSSDSNVARESLREIIGSPFTWAPLKGKALFLNEKTASELGRG
jgi:hypothetical protein